MTSTADTPAKPSLLARLFGKGGDDRAPYRILWHRIVEIAREPAWYTTGGIADTLPGRFDTITLVLALVLLRMESDDTLTEATVRLAELFVDDMDGQLRESGVGDLVVGKHIGRLMSVLGGRLGAYRDGLASEDPSVLTAALERNVTRLDGADIAALAALTRALADDLARIDRAQLLAGVIAQ